MIVGHLDAVKAIPIVSDAAQGIAKKVLVSPAEGWDGYVMRVFDVESKGHTPRHSHPWPHINWIIKGEGILQIDGTDYPVKEGSFAYVPSNAVHQFTNAGSTQFSFICIVPEDGDV